MTTYEGACNWYYVSGKGIHGLGSMGDVGGDGILFEPPTIGHTLIVLGVNGLTTSPVQEILEQTDEHFLVKTRNSVYKIELIK